MSKNIVTENQHVEEFIPKHSQIICDLNEIHMGIMSAKDVRKMSVIEITNPKLMGAGSVYDTRLGLNDESGVCPTCNERIQNCIGHFGHISLCDPILHPMFLKKIVSVLKCFCHVCYGSLIPDGAPLGQSMEFYVNLVKKTIPNKNQCPHCALELKARTVQITKVDDAIVIKHYESAKRCTVGCSADSGCQHPQKSARECKTIDLSGADIQRVLYNVSGKDLVRIGLTEDIRSLVITTLPVLPICARPAVVINGAMHDDDLTIQYNDIVKINARIVRFREELAETDSELENLEKPCVKSAKMFGEIVDSSRTGADLEERRAKLEETRAGLEQKIEKNQQSLRFRVKCLFDNSRAKLKHINGRAFKSIKERIGGKHGQVRGNMMGKRVDQSARSAISPDPRLDTDQVGVPQLIADALYYEEKVCMYNRDRIQGFLDKHLVKSIIRQVGGKTRYINVEYNMKNNRDVPALEDGDIIHRPLMDNDWVVVNRQPTLHKLSMIAMRVKVLPGRTIRLNVAICSQFNADFDGDEMNLHVPIAYDSISEVSQLMSVASNLSNPQSGFPAIGLIQESVLASYMMTQENACVSTDDFVDILVKAGFSTESVAQSIRRAGLHQNPSGAVSARTLLSMALPSKFQFDGAYKANGCENRVRIVNGMILEGVFTKAVVGRGNSSIFKTLVQVFAPEEVLRVLNIFQFICTEWLSRVGFSIGLGDCENPDPHAIRGICAEQVKTLVAQNHSKEYRIVDALNGIKDMCMNYSKNFRECERTEGPGANQRSAMGKSCMESSALNTCIQSGAKGDIFNVCQVMSMLGQQSVGGKRIVPRITKSTRTLVHDNGLAAKSFQFRGFVSNSFYNGLSPIEYYFHSMGGREGIIDTAMKTAGSGYLERKIVKMTEDVKVAWDGTVRGDSNRIIQLMYGEHGIDPSRAHRGNLPCDVESIVANTL